MDQSPEQSHRRHMRRAIEIARRNPQAPFGAILVDQRSGEIVAEGVNQSLRNPTFHGEMVAINDYVARGGEHWERLILYTTAEPCCMCQGAVLWAGIPQVVFGTSIRRLRSLGWNQIGIAAEEVVARSWRPHVIVVGGICREECDRLFLNVS